MMKTMKTIVTKNALAACEQAELARTAMRKSFQKGMVMLVKVKQKRKQEAAMMKTKTISIEAEVVQREAQSRNARMNFRLTENIKDNQQKMPRLQDIEM